MFYVYVLEGKSKEHYIGFTTNLTRRMREHNDGKSTSTAPYRPWKCIYCEICLNEIDARRRERYLKTSQGRRMLRRRLKEYLNK